MNPTGQHNLTVLLADARRSGWQIAELDPSLEPATPTEAYVINGLVAERLGWPLLGWKIAGTTPDMQRRLRLSHPIYGRTFERFATSSPAHFARADLLDPLIECEFFFRLRYTLPARAAPYVAIEVADAIASCHAGVEVAECRFPLDRLPGVPAILADGAASGRYVIGPEIIDWRSRDLAAMPVTLAVNGIERRRGSGRDVMGDPLNPLVWLANERSAWGDGLAAGALISTGTATGMLLAKPGDRMQARFGEQAVIDLAFA